MITSEDVDRDNQEVWDDLTARHQALKAKIAEAAESGDSDHPTGEYELDRSLARRSRPPCRPTACGRSTRSSCACPTASRSIPSWSSSSSAAARRSARTAGSTGHTPSRSRSPPCSPKGSPAAHGPGHRARHLQPAPHGPARRQDRAARVADPEPARGARPAGAAQQPAFGDRMPGLRVRLQHGGAGDARAVGGAVRGLRELRPGDHRPVHRLRTGEVGRDLPDHAAAAARIRRFPARSTPQDGSSASCSSPPRGTSASRTSRRRRSTSISSGARPGSPSSGRSS